MPLSFLQPWRKADAVIRAPDGTTIDLSSAVTSAHYYGSTDEGCYIQLGIADIEHVLLTGPLIDDILDVELAMTTGGCDWLLSEIDKTDDGYTLTLYDATLARAKRRRLPTSLKASRGSSTRIEFVVRLFAKAGLPIYAPDKGDVVPIEGLTAADAKALRDATQSAKAFNKQHSNNVYVLGDELASGSDADLKAALGDDWTVHTNATAGRIAHDGLTVLAALGGIAQTLVIELGTNDTDVSVFGDDIAAIMELAGENRRVIWVNISKTGLPSATDLNAQLTQAADLNSNLAILDWHSAVARNEVNLVDGMHPDAAGYRLRARRIAAAIRGAG